MGFEGEGRDGSRLLWDITHLIESISKIDSMLPTARINPIEDDISSYVGSHAYLRYRYENQKRETSKKEEVVVRQRCLSFVVRLVTELWNRLPSNFETLRTVSQMSVSQCLHPIKRLYSSPC